VKILEELPVKEIEVAVSQAPDSCVKTSYFVIHCQGELSSHLLNHLITLVLEVRSKDRSKLDLVSASKMRNLEQFHNFYFVDVIIKATVDTWNTDFGYWLSDQLK
jgi:hypothetical protein